MNTAPPVYLEQDYLSARHILKGLNPYMKRLIKKTPRGYITLENRLIPEHFLNTIYGVETWGMFSGYKTGVLIFDIDLHGDYINNSFREHDRLNRLFMLMDKLGTPSLIFQSSSNMGLHVYYLLNQMFPASALELLTLRKLGMTKQELNALKIEILPKPEKAIKFMLAVKEGGALLRLNKSGLERVKLPRNNRAVFLKTQIDKSEKFFVGEILIDTPLKSILLHQNQKAVKTALRNEARILDHEAEYNLQFLTNGSTNQQIDQICFNYYSNKLSVNEAFERLDQKFTNSRVIRKSDTQGHRLFKRVESLYNNWNKEKRDGTLIKKIAGLSETTEDLFLQNNITAYTEYLINKYHLAPQRRGALIRFLSSLYSWTKHIRALSMPKIMDLNILYKGFYTRVHTLKLIPLPWVLMAQWNDRYNEIIEILKRDGLIKIGANYYAIPQFIKENNPDVQGICKYYSVNLEIIDNHRAHV